MYTHARVRAQTHTHTYIRTQTHIQRRAHTNYQNKSTLGSSKADTCIVSLTDHRRYFWPLMSEWQRGNVLRCRCPLSSSPLRSLSSVLLPPLPFSLWMLSALCACLSSYFSTSSSSSFSYSRSHTDTTHTHTLSRRCFHGVFRCGTQSWKRNFQTQTPVFTQTRTTARTEFGSSASFLFFWVFLFVTSKPASSFTTAKLVNI